MTKSLMVLLLVSTPIFGCSNHAPSVSITVGQNKEEVRKILGDPSSVETSIKSSKIIWGAEEEFWDETPTGAELETWSYEQSEGILNLYFVGRSDKLGYKAFSPEGVVYESSSE